MTPRWYRKGAVVQADEIGMCTFTAPSTGWLLVQNRYGHIAAFRLPFWTGLRARLVSALRTRA